MSGLGFKALGVGFRALGKPGFEFRLHVLGSGQKGLSTPQPHASPRSPPLGVRTPKSFSSSVVIAPLIFFIIVVSLLLSSSLVYSCYFDR